MREMKFRAKNNYTGKFWYSDEYVGLHKFFKAVDSGILNHETVGQYTGLKDKNGKEIYEGDIVNDSWVVEAHPFCWLLRKGLHGAAKHVNTFYEDAYEVIGNIYENKELLE